MQIGPKEVPNCRQHAAAGESTMWKPLTRMTSKFKVMSDACLKLEKDLAPAMTCITRESSKGQPLACNDLLVGSRKQTVSEHKTTVGKH